ncbi:MAG: DUF72 domain-containing protein [Sandaracinaceae bacterium]|nr:DUF72 domain-containing protein [Sandaracinaceae bacterium]
MRQIGLFGDPEREALEAFAARVPANVRLGTSSWTFEGWKGIVYRDTYTSKQDFGRNSLAEYARHPLFRTVGIDRGFYAPMGAPELEEQARQLPPGFRACLKVWSEITTRVFTGKHPRAGEANPSFLDPERYAGEVHAPLAQAFAEHVGVIILELSPAPGDAEAPLIRRALERFFERAPRDFPFAVELRDRRLFDGDYVELVHEAGASHVLSLHPRMPSVGAQLARLVDRLGDRLGDRVGDRLDGTVLVRLSLAPGRSYASAKRAFSPFDKIVEPHEEMRADVARVIEAARGASVYVIANNKVEGSSPLTIRALAERLAGRNRK